MELGRPRACGSSRARRAARATCWAARSATARPHARVARLAKAAGSRSPSRSPEAPRQRREHAHAADPERRRHLQDRRHDDQPRLAPGRDLHGRRRLQPRLGHRHPPRLASAAARARMPGGARRDRARAGTASGLEVSPRHARERGSTRWQAKGSASCGRSRRCCCSRRSWRWSAALLGRVAAALGLAGLRLLRRQARSPAAHPAGRIGADAQRGLPDRSAGRGLRPGRDRRLSCSTSPASRGEPRRQRAAAGDLALVLAVVLAIVAHPRLAGRPCPSRPRAGHE